MKVISFSLWGTDPKYTIGALKNADLLNTVYDGWMGRFYIDETTVPQEIQSNLRNRNNVEVINMGKFTNRSSSWRFLSATEDIMISRDCDSRINERDKCAVDEWLSSDKNFHVIRDHPGHKYWPINAGMWGVRNKKLINIKSLLDEFFNYHNNNNDHFIDQHFLYCLYPHFEKDGFFHDEFNIVFGITGNKIKHVRKNLEHIGQVFDENDNILSKCI